MPGQWTRKDIERWLVAAYALAPRVTTPAAREPTAWPALYVLEYQDRRAIQIWALAEAGRLDLHISEWCAAQGAGWSRATFERRKARALEQIEVGLNAQQARKCA